VPSTTTTTTSTAALPIAPPAAVVATPTVQSAPQVVPQTNIASASPAAFQSTFGSMQSFKDQLNATKERSANMGRPGTPGGNNSVGGQISQSVNDTKARLEKMKEGLPHGQNASQSTGTPGSPAIA